MVVDVTVTIDSETVSVPTVETGARDVTVFDGVSFLGDTIALGSLSFSLPVFSLPETTIIVPTVDVNTQFVRLPNLPTFRVPVDVWADISVTWTTTTIPFFNTTITYPSRVTLRGPSLEFDFIGGQSLGSIPVPDVEVGSILKTIGGGTVGGETITLSLPTIDLPQLTIPRLTVPDVPTISVGSFTVTVPDPTTLTAAVTVDAAALRSLVFEPLPQGFVSSPTSWALDAVLTAFVDDLSDSLLRRTKGVLNAVLEFALDDETKERIRESPRE